jgi:hypothetical protein
MSNKKEKDPFQEYDKFWDELDKIEEAKEDQDYFKDKNKDYGFKKVSQTNQDRFNQYSNIQKRMSTLFLIFFLGIGLIFLMMPVGMGFPFFVRIPSIVFFLIFISIIVRILNKSKN